MSYPLFACGGQAAETASAGAFPDNGEEEVMEDRFQMIGQYLMIRMPEEVDHHQAVILSEKADRYILKEKVDHIVFDFEDTRFMDSSGIGIIMGRYRKIACFGGQVYAIHADSRIRRIIGISGLKKVLHIIEEDGHEQ